MPSKGETNKRFEDALRELEALVTRLESGDLGLEEALAAFEQGIGLVRLLNDKLNRADKRVEILTRDANGALRLSAPDPPDEESS